jgi:hypothetical protein
MEETSAGIESELPDLSAESVATLRSVELSGITLAVERVQERVADAEGSMGGYSPSFMPRPEAEDQ